jgi:ubiquinone/menaquinone biosynthesis C-methylase UbiE
MPSSHFHLIPTIIATIGRYPDKKILDIGCGSGKYGILINEYCHSCPPNEKEKCTLEVDAIEVNKAYINSFGKTWEAAYNCFYIMDALAFDYELKRYDLYLLLNIIDHLTKDDAIALMKRIPGDMLIAVPQTLYQEDHKEDSECHKSFWTRQDFDDIFGGVYKVEHIPNPYEGQLTDNMILIQKTDVALKWNGEKWI